jgi:hypothetical protein
MRLLHLPLALALALVVVANVSADGDDKGKGGKRKHLVRGRVQAVQKDADKDSGAIEVAVRHRKKGEQGKGEVKMEKFKITPDTKFEIARREGKGDIDRKPATFADVHKGERVAILPLEGAREVAQRVEILVGKKGKAKQNADN